MAPRARELVWIYNIAGTQVLPIHDLSDLTVEDRLGDLETLTFTIRRSDPKAYALIPDVVVSYADRRYRIEELRDFRAGAGAYTEVYAEALWMDLGKRARAGSFSLLGQTALAGLSTILLGSGWTADVDPADVAQYSMEDIDATLLTLVRRWAAIIGREIEWDTVAQTVTLVPAIGQDRGIGFRYGYNLRRVERRYRPPIATRLYAFGANNLEITGVNPLGTQYVEDFSWYTAQGLTLTQARALYRKDQVWIDNRYLLALNLYDAAVRRLAGLAQPAVSYELSVADFSRLTSSPADDVELGDTVRVRDPAFGIDIATRVVRLLRRPLRSQDNQIELAYLQPGLADVDDPEQSRAIDYGELAVLVDANAAIQTITGVATILASIQITSTGETTVVAGGTIKGTATGTGTVRWSLAVDGVDQVPTYDFAFTAGQVEFSWPTFASGIDASSTKTVTWRGRVVSGSGTVAVAVGEGRGWLLVRGAVGVGVSNSPNQAIEETIAYVLPTLDDDAVVEMISPVEVDEEEAIAYELPTLDDNDPGAPPDVDIT
jgi:hypothetical protein